MIGCHQVHNNVTPRQTYGRFSGSIVQTIWINSEITLSTYFALEMSLSSFKYSDFSFKSIARYSLHSTSCTQHGGQDAPPPLNYFRVTALHDVSPKQIAKWDHGCGSRTCSSLQLSIADIESMDDYCSVSLAAQFQTSAYRLFCTHCFNFSITCC